MRRNFIMPAFAVSILIMVSQWFYFKKMGLNGWEAIIPLYNLYVLFKALYGNGWKMLLLLIPIYNIYITFKLNIDLAHAFGQGTGFGIGLTLLPFVFSPILGFGPATYNE